MLVQVKACGVVPNLINVLTHWENWFPELPLPKLPAIFGLDVAGVVAAVGERVQNFRKGDRVYVNPGLFCGSCPACRADEVQNCTNYTFSGYFGFGPDSQKQFDAYPYGGMCEYMVAPQHNLVRAAGWRRVRASGPLRLYRHGLRRAAQSRCGAGQNHLHQRTDAGRWGLAQRCARSAAA